LLLAVSFNGYAQTSPIKQTSSGGNHQVASVALTSISIKSNETNKAILKWSAANEVNNSHFDVLISTDGSNFVKYVTVPGKGTTNERTDYEIVINLKSRILTGSLFLSFLLISSVRNKKLRMGILALFAFMVISCSKKEEVQKIYYVKLVQFDDDRKTTESPIVIVNAKITK